MEAPKTEVTDEQRRERLAPLLEKWIPLLQLQNWEIKFTLVDNLGTNSNKPTAASMDAGPYYRTITIGFARSQIDLHEDGQELERLVVHELAHAFFVTINEVIITHIGHSGTIQDAIHNAEETVVDTLTSIFLHLNGDESGPYYFVAPDNGKEPTNGNNA